MGKNKVKITEQLCGKPLGWIDPQNNQRTSHNLLAAIAPRLCFAQITCLSVTTSICGFAGIRVAVLLLVQKGVVQCDKLCKVNTVTFRGKVCRGKCIADNYGNRTVLYTNQTCQSFHRGKRICACCYRSVLCPLSWSDGPTSARSRPETID